MQQKRIAGKRGRPRSANSPRTTRTGKETIGERLLRLRSERGLTQRDLAAPGVSYAYISRIEAGAREPSLRAIRILARKLGVTPEYLETGELVPLAARREWRLGTAELELRAGGDLDAAETIFHSEERTADDARLRARAQAGLGLVAARRNQPREAIALLEAATSAGQLTPETRPDIYDALGQLYLAADAGERAVTLYETCLRDVSERALDDSVLRARFAIRLASAQATTAALDRTRAALDDATRLACERSVPFGRARLYWQQASAAWDNDPEAGLALIRRALALLQAEDEVLQAARSHVDAARLLTIEARYDDASVHLDRAERLFTLTGTADDLARLRTEQAKLAAYRGHGEQALVLAAEAAELIGDDARERAMVAHAYGAAHAAADNAQAAEASYRQALEALTDARQWRDAAHVARELSHLLRGLDREREAYELVDHASLLMIRHVARVGRPVDRRAR